VAIDGAAKVRFIRPEPKLNAKVELLGLQAIRARS